MEHHNRPHKLRPEQMGNPPAHRRRKLDVLIRKRIPLHPADKLLHKLHKHTRHLAIHIRRRNHSRIPPHARIRNHTERHRDHIRKNTGTERHLLRQRAAQRKNKIRRRIHPPHKHNNKTDSTDSIRKTLPKQSKNRRRIQPHKLHHTQHRKQKSKHIQLLLLRSAKQ